MSASITIKKKKITEAAAVVPTKATPTALFEF
jgi:hypothetical protein